MEDAELRVLERRGSWRSIRRRNGGRTIYRSTSDALDPVIRQKSLYFLERCGKRSFITGFATGFGQYAGTASGEYVNAYEIADEKRNADEPMMLALGETVEFGPDAAPERELNLYDG